MTLPRSDAHFDTRAENPSASPPEPAHWGGVFSVMLCIFALITSEYLPVTLLTLMAADLRVSEGQVGYGMAMSGAWAVLTSLSISTLAGSMNRKTLLLLLTGLMGVSGLVIGLASGYMTYLIGRALIGVVVGGFWSLSAAVAMRLVPIGRVPMALAVFNGGAALASVVAAPLGSYLSGFIGWRGALLCLVPVVLVVLVWQWASLPSMVASQPPEGGPGRVVQPLRNPVLRRGLLAVGVFFMGQFTLFTHVRPFLESVTRLEGPTLSMLLLVLGVAGVVGTVLIGRCLRTGLYRTLMAIPLLMATIALGLIAFGDRMAVTFVLLGLWGLVATAAPVGWWSWVARTLPQEAEVGGGLMVATIQLCIALGSTLGGLLFDASGHRTTFLVSAALLVLAAVLAGLTAQAQRRQACS